MDKILLTLTIGAIGSYIGHKANVPAGILLGAMFAVGIFNIVSGGAKVPSSLSVISQIIIGSVIGLSFTMDKLKMLRTLIVPSIIVIVGLLVMSVILGLILYRFSDLDIATSLFATCSGALTSMGPLSEALKAQAHIVVLFHTLRLVAVITLMPPIITWCVKILKLTK